MNNDDDWPFFHRKLLIEFPCNEFNMVDDNNNLIDDNNLTVDINDLNSIIPALSPEFENLKIFLANSDGSFPYDIDAAAVPLKLLQDVLLTMNVVLINRMPFKISSFPEEIH